MITKIIFIEGEGIDNQTEAERREVFNKMADHLRNNPQASIEELFEVAEIPTDSGGSELTDLNDHTVQHEFYPLGVQIIEETK